MQFDWTSIIVFGGEGGVSNYDDFEDDHSISRVCLPDKPYFALKQGQAHHVLS